MYLKLEQLGIIVRIILQATRERHAPKAHHFGSQITGSQSVAPAI